MHISWHGQYTIKIQSDDVVVVLDPYAPTLGLAPFRAKADIVALTNPADSSMSHLDAIQGDPYIIKTPGEYSIRDCTLHALAWRDEQGHEKSLHLWNIEKVSVLHLGALSRPLTDVELQELEKREIDVLLLPIGGGSGLTTKQALSLATTIEPRLLIPIHYALPQLKEELDGVEQFAREMGVSLADAQPKIIVKANKLPQEEMMTALLSV